MCSEPQLDDTTPSSEGSTHVLSLHHDGHLVNEIDQYNTDGPPSSMSEEVVGVCVLNHDAVEFVPPSLKDDYGEELTHECQVRTLHSK